MLGIVTTLVPEDMCVAISPVIVGALAVCPKDRVICKVLCKNCHSPSIGLETIGQI